MEELEYITNAGLAHNAASSPVPCSSHFIPAWTLQARMLSGRGRCCTGLRPKSCRATGFKIEVRASKTSISIELDTGWRFVLALWKAKENPFLHSHMYRCRPAQLTAEMFCHSAAGTSSWLHCGFRLTWHWVNSGVLRFLLYYKNERSKKNLIEV